MDHTLTQYSLKKGLDKLKKDEEEAVIEEFKQLHTRGTFKPMLKEKLSLEEKQRALPLLMFLKEKRDKKIKGRTCADGRKQRLGVKKKDVDSPTVSIEAVFLSALIDTHKGRYVVTTNIPSAHLNAEMDINMFMMLEGVLAKLLVKVALQSALLFYMVLRKDLEDQGFV
eukprot:9455439-Ditylum_brightwellii.AAC.1